MPDQDPQHPAAEGADPGATARLQSPARQDPLPHMRPSPPEDAAAPARAIVSPPPTTATTADHFAFADPSGPVTHRQEGVASPPPGTDGGQPPPPVASPRGMHVGWVRLERRPEEEPPPARQASPASPVADPATAAAVAVPPDFPAVTQPAPPRPHLRETPPRVPRIGRGNDRPAALGRLAAVVVTLGLAWAIALSLMIWAIVLLVG
ncbi:MAG TPA: hypothetical protein VNE62_02820 [Actinomycetota bacterium]|nr:hypothetical protein [Actinomycetota bacterium]